LSQSRVLPLPPLLLLLLLLLLLQY